MSTTNPDTKEPHMAVNQHGINSFTWEQWAALRDAEADLYNGEQGIFPYTEVNDFRGGSDHSFMRSLWTDAEEYVAQDGLDERDEQEQIEECARRVALAKFVLAFGTEYGAAQAAQAGQAGWGA